MNKEQIKQEKVNKNIMTVTIDIGKFHHATALLTHEGKVVATLSCFPNTQDGFQELLTLITCHLPAGEELRIGMEATWSAPLKLATLEPELIHATEPT